jgi:hypothetical protein
MLKALVSLAAALLMLGPDPSEPGALEAVITMLKCS